MPTHDPLRWLDTQADRMHRLLNRWCAINSGSTNLAGLARMAGEVERHFSKLAPVRHHTLPQRRIVDAAGNTVRQPLGQALTLSVRPRARRRALLAIHMDTVYPADSPFQQCTAMSKHRLRGPGVVDAKGGLLVMLFALLALERTSPGNALGWHVAINPDEELGSPGSTRLLQQFARRSHVGLVFEPALPDGSLVSQRKGSGNFTIVVRGRAAHAGRDFDKGRNAIAAAARLIDQLDRLTDLDRGITVNVARLEGGSPNNQVPDVAVIRFNIRYRDQSQEAGLHRKLDALVRNADQQPGYGAALDGEFNAPPKPLDDATAALLSDAQHCGRQIGLTLDTQPTGGVCDGNRLAAAGLPTIDTLGPQGGNLHSDREFINRPSLLDRAKLTTLLLLKLAEPNAPANTRR